jgi:hypothetical protein
LEDAIRIVANYVEHYNGVRLHGAIRYIAPAAIPRHGAFSPCTVLAEAPLRRLRRRFFRPRSALAAGAIGGKLLGVGGGGFMVLFVPPEGNTGRKAMKACPNPLKP